MSEYIDFTEEFKKSSPDLFGYRTLEGDLKELLESEGNPMGGPRCIPPESLNIPLHLKDAEIRLKFDGTDPKPSINVVLDKVFKDHPKLKLYKVGFTPLEGGGMLTISGHF